MTGHDSNFSLNEGNAGGEEASARRPELSLDELAEGVRSGDRAVLGRAITLVESSVPRHQELAERLITRLMPFTGSAFRIGITGVPGAGKSTFIEALGKKLTAEEHRVAVLAVDPSSSVSGGSILGDKTRMARLGVDRNAFIRPSPSAGTLGGVAGKTRESMLLCEAAGFDVVLVETIGVGQSETVVAEMTDFFLVLMIAGAGDELQGMKRGILEIADMIVVNKADGENIERAEQAARGYESALGLMRSPESGWHAPVLTCSAREGRGLEEIWKAIEAHRRQMVASGYFDENRREQRLHWMWAMVDDRLRTMVQDHPGVKRLWTEVVEEVRSGKVPPAVGASRILQAFTAGNPPE